MDRVTASGPGSCAACALCVRISGARFAAVLAVILMLPAGVIAAENSSATQAMQLARDLGFRVREEPLGDLPGGACAVGGKRQILLNAAHPSSQRLDTLLEILAVDPGVAGQPVSHLLESRLRRHRSDH